MTAMARKRTRRFDGAPDFHAREAMVWAGHAPDEVRPAIAKAKRGECRGALEAVLRAERKATLMGANAAQARGVLSATDMKRVKRAMQTVQRGTRAVLARCAFTGGKRSRR